MKDYLKLLLSIILVAALSATAVGTVATLIINYNHSEERDVIIDVPSPSELLKEIEK